MALLANGVVVVVVGSETMSPVLQCIVRMRIRHKEQ